ncbi:Asp-tRNA(Asn)/Glu-tRNA(Gln) amidotransferase GatCAB subunit A, partial [Alloalcanivorax gelatiniphagus]
MNGHEGGVADTARALRSGALSSETLTRHLLERAEARQSLNAFMALQPDLALAQARAADRALAAGEAP